MTQMVKSSAEKEQAMINEIQLLKSTVAKYENLAAEYKTHFEQTSMDLSRRVRGKGCAYDMHISHNSKIEEEKDREIAARMHG